MTDQSARIRAWLADLRAINAEIDAHGLPMPRVRTTRARKRQPFWEE